VSNEQEDEAEAIVYHEQIAYEQLVIELESQPEGEENYLADLYDPKDNFDGRR